MIPFWKVQAIRALLAEDELSQRKIAKRLDVGRGVVSRIANGTRPNYRPAAVDSPVAPLPKPPWRRCPQCGALVQPPCLACRARGARRAYRRPSSAPGFPAGDESLRLRLSGPQQARYEEVCARRRALLASGGTAAGSGMHPARRLTTRPG